MGADGLDVREERRRREPRDDVVRDSGLQRLAAARRDETSTAMGRTQNRGRVSGQVRSARFTEVQTRLAQRKGKKTDPNVVPWSPILITSATLSFIMMAPIGMPCRSPQPQ